ncbi:MAG: cytochrome ubiquinol oxidase subunit I [Nitrospirae bacterium]|nr:cytochrome ubiquinol oxidase subunit I [Nitrospirota bacterium]
MKRPLPTALTLTIAFLGVALSVGPGYAQAPEAVPYAIPGVENRALIWVAAQMHILFAAFILGAPIFVVISEWIGMRKRDPRYDRLAKEVTKVTAILYSMTALTGGLFILFLVGLYPSLTAFMVSHFFPIFAVVYPLLFIAETLVLYLYWYTWDTLTGEKKGRHVAIGVLLNIVGLTTLAVINAPTSFMNTPPHPIETATLWESVYNYSWMPLNLHRTIGNITFGGFITGMIAAYMYMFSKTPEERAYYDWMGFVGNLIGVGASLLLPLAGYILAAEFFDYDASIGPYMMADQLSMYFEMQGALVGLIFMASNLYIWLSMKRITGIETLKLFGIPSIAIVKLGFAIILIGNAIWMTPHGFSATQATATEALELPSDWGFLALMPAKNTAAGLIVLVTIINYIIYNRAIRRGTIHWGKIDFMSQFVLIFLAFSAIWTMGLMGAVRSLVRKYFHVYILFPDYTPESYTPTLAHASILVTAMTLVFFGVVSFAIWLSLGAGKAKGS